jgi:ABC-type sugar transport system permease subunit
MAKDKTNKKSLKLVISEFFFNIWSKVLNWYRVSKFGAIVQQIGWFVGYALWPFAWIKARTFDKLRFDIQKKVISILFLLPVMLGFVIFFAYPLIMSLIYSFSTVTLSSSGVEILFNQFFSKADMDAVSFINPLQNVNILYNYSYALTIDADYPVQLLSSLGTMASDCAVITIFSLLIAVMLNGNFKGRAAARAIFFLPVIFNSEAVSAALVNSPLVNPNEDALTALFDMGKFMQGIGIPKFLITFLTGITDGIYDTISYSGIQILIFLTAIQSVPKHLYEAARIEGATQYEMFWKITLPMVSAMIPTVIVYTVVDSFLRSSINKVIQVYEEQSNYGVHAAMSWIYLGVVAVFLVVVLGILSKVVFYYDDKK